MAGLSRLLRLRKDFVTPRDKVPAVVLQPLTRKCSGEVWAPPCSLAATKGMVLRQGYGPQVWSFAKATDHKF